MIIRSFTLPIFLVTLSFILFVKSEPQKLIFWYFFPRLKRSVWIKSLWVVGIVKYPEVTYISIEYIVVEETIISHLHLINFLGNNRVRVILRVYADNVDLFNGHNDSHQYRRIISASCSRGRLVKVESSVVRC